MSQQYDVTAEQRQIIEERAKRRSILRHEFQKQASDPFRHASGEGGTVFDPAFQRYQAMKVSQYEYFKPTARTTGQGMLLFLIPYVGFTYWVYKSRSTKEAAYRNGEVAYKDRYFKFA